MSGCIGRGVEDAKLIILDKVCTHLEKTTAHAKILFTDFTLAFNLMQPLILVHKLIYNFYLGNSLLPALLISCLVAVSVFLWMENVT